MLTRSLSCNNHELCWICEQTIRWLLAIGGHSGHICYLAAWACITSPYGCAFCLRHSSRLLTGMVCMLIALLIWKKRKYVIECIIFKQMNWKFCLFWKKKRVSVFHFLGNRLTPDFLCGSAWLRCFLCHSCHRLNLRYKFITTCPIL